MRRELLAGLEAGAAWRVLSRRHFVGLRTATLGTVQAFGVLLILECSATAICAPQKSYAVVVESAVLGPSGRGHAVAEVRGADRSSFTVELSNQGLSLEHQATAARWGLRLARVGSFEPSAAEGLISMETAPDRQTRSVGALLDEWLQFGPDGWQHGFTVRDGDLRGARGELRLQLVSQGDFSALPGKDEREILFAQNAGQLFVRYSGLQVFDAAGVKLESRFVAHRGGVDIVVEAQAAVFPILVDPWIDPMVLTGPDHSGHLGHSIAISGDTLVAASVFDGSDCVGVNCDPATGGFLDASGAAVVFVRTSEGWQRQAYLKASNPGQYDSFGRCVAISGDTIVVGADGEDSNATGVNGNQSDNSLTFAGAAYVFVRTGSTWAQQAYLKPSNTRSFLYFGRSLAIDGDTIVIASQTEPSNATGVGGDQTNTLAPGAGAAYVFFRSGSTWSQQAYLKASNTGSGDNFGYSLAIHGDTIAVGAESESSAATGVNGNGADNSALYAGAAYVFHRAGGVWSGPDYLKPSNTASNHHFGWSIDVSGDTVVVGQPGDDGPAIPPQAGSAIVFTRSGGNWSQQARLLASNPGAYDNFGWSVAVDGGRIVVGAVLEQSAAAGLDGDGLDNSVLDAGAAYLFENTGGSWNFSHYIKATAPQANARFGEVVDVSNEIVAVHSPGEWFPGPPVHGGSVRLYEFGTPTQLVCPGDGTGLGCPCANTGGAGRGCGNSSVAGGALLLSTGDAQLGSDSLRLRVEGINSGAGLLVQGTTTLGQSLGQPFGDGLFCVGGQIQRIAVVWPSGGSAHYPRIGTLDPPISIAGLVAASGIRVYQCWYRDASTFCTPATFNLTNGLSVPWQ